MSQATNSGFLPSFFSFLASFPVAVVLPAPWRPHIIKYVMSFELNLSLLSPCPMIFTSSSWTIFITCCPGVKLSITSEPKDLSLTLFIKPLTTLKLTSASRSDILTSFIAKSISFSVNLPLPLSFCNAFWSLSDKFSNIAIPR